MSFKYSDYGRWRIRIIVVDEDFIIGGDCDKCYQTRTIYTLRS